jgi:hypothetical protein
VTLAAGIRLGHFEIVSPLGAGGMGEVDKARDTGLDRTIAIKIRPSAIPIDKAFCARSNDPDSRQIPKFC